MVKALKLPLLGSFMEGTHVRRGWVDWSMVGHDITIHAQHMTEELRMGVCVLMNEAFALGCTK